MSWHHAVSVSSVLVVFAAGCTSGGGAEPGKNAGTGASSGNGGSAGAGDAPAGGGSGNSSGSVGGSSGDTGGSLPGSACDSCVETQCLAQLAACDSDPDCVAFWGCAEKCSDEICFDQCVAQHPSGAQKDDAIWQCADQRCTAACGGGGGGGGGGDGPCNDCIDTKCAGPLAACESDPECIAFWDCADGCPDQACFEQCISKHPAGAEKDLAVEQCIDQQCAAACGGNS
jgi:hypothetical protein